MMAVEERHRVVCRLDELLEARGLTLAALAEEVGVTVVNLSVLKNNRAKAIRFSTLTALCDALGCQPGDLCAASCATSQPGPRPEARAPVEQLREPLINHVRWRHQPRTPSISTWPGHCFMVPVSRKRTCQPSAVRRSCGVCMPLAFWWASFTYSRRGSL